MHIVGTSQLAHELRDMAMRFLRCPHFLPIRARTSGVESAEAAMAFHSCQMQTALMPRWRSCLFRASLAVAPDSVSRRRGDGGAKEDRSARFSQDIKPDLNGKATAYATRAPSDPHYEVQQRSPASHDETGKILHTNHKSARREFSLIRLLNNKLGAPSVL